MNVIWLQRRHAGRTSADGSRATRSANVSRVISGCPRSDAKRTIADQCGAGIPPGLVRQPLTVDSERAKSAATAPVPPSASMIEPAVIMTEHIVRSLRTSQVFASRETTFSARHGEISWMVDPPKVIGERLRRVRLACEVETRAAFAEEIGVEKNTYSPWEKGSRLLTFEGACLIRKKYGIPVAYLFWGEIDGLTVRMFNKLKEIA